MAKDDWQFSEFMSDWRAIVGLIAVCVLGLLVLNRLTVRQMKNQARRIVYATTPETLGPSFEGWTLAVIARFNMNMGRPVDRFQASWFQRQGLEIVLQKDWQITSAATLSRALQQLNDVGYRHHYGQATGEPVATFLAWDYGRIVWLAWAGHQLGWLDRQAMATWVARAASAMQSTYADWGAFATGYLRGLTQWSKEVSAAGEPEISKRAFETLMTDPTSPWRRVPWLTRVMAREGALTGQAAAMQT
ncbi:DUF1266 domain-containing protein [Pendulispora albinea]|uniref:DUF1266 domain-containing protein n=1 Tax=Pendulispora albinea TaxID=2741071 RepID=A0ABZ2M5P7_9BACT